MTESTEATDGEEPVEIGVEPDGPGADELEAEEPAADEGPRAVAFETAREELGDVFDIDGRRGETITDLRTTDTDEGRQLVATVEKSRTTMFAHRVDSAKRTGRRVGSGTAVLAVLAGVAYAVLAVRRLLGGGGPADIGGDGPPLDDAPAGGDEP